MTSSSNHPIKLEVTYKQFVSLQEQLGAMVQYFTEEPITSDDQIASDGILIQGVNISLFVIPRLHVK